jgi:hypothetical protein
VKKHSNSVKKSESPMKRRNPRAAERRDSSEVMADLVSQLRQQFEVKSVSAAESAGDERDGVRPNLDRLTVGVDLGDQWSNCCILGLGGETLGEGQFRTRRQEVGEVSGVITIAPGESVLFSVPVTHVGSRNSRWHMEIPFKFDAPHGKGVGDALAGGEPIMALWYSHYDLPDEGKTAFDRLQ